MANTSHTSTAPIIIKKYANRRLYNTQTSSYVTLDVLSQMVKDGVEFTVHDAKSGEDITRSVLTQIIFEEECALAGAPRQLDFGLRMVAPVIMTFGNDEQKKRFLPGILSGEDWWCQGYSEPGSGSDLASLRCSAKR
ncbi:MAG TPA: hypothetical protein EYQ81_06260, partial [Sneathiellales bacterium]|nr:hypothetical protein [Sneathiellales bacterium]